MRMQRRMLWAVLAIFGLVVLFFGAKYAKKEYRLRQPDRIWVPITLRQDLSMEDQKKLAEQIEEKLRALDKYRRVRNRTRKENSGRNLYAHYSRRMADDRDRPGNWPAHQPRQCAASRGFLKHSHNAEAHGGERGLLFRETRRA